MGESEIQFLKGAPRRKRNQIMLNLENINARFRNAGEIILKLRWLNIILFLLVFAASIAGLQLIRADVDQDHWFLEGDAQVAVKERFEQIFGNDDFCAVLVEADNVFTPEVLTGIRELGKELEAKVPCADDVLSLADMEYIQGTKEGLEIIDLVPEAIPRSPEGVERIKQMTLAKQSLKNRIVSDDGRQTWVLLRMKPIPKDWGRNNGENPELAVGRIVNEVAGQKKYANLHPKTAGLPVINVEKRNFFAKETPRLFGLSLLVTVLTLAFSLRSLRGVAFPLVAAAGSVIIVFGAQGYLGIAIDPSMIFLPVFLSIALATGYSIHLFNFFRREFLRTGLRRQALVTAIEETGWPLLFCTLTTVAALLSFLLVPLRPIRWVGLSSASLVGVTYLLVIVVLPSLLSFGKNREPHQVYTEKGGRLTERLMDRLGSRALLRPKTTLIVFALIVAACLAGMARFEVSFDVRRTFGLKIPYVNRLNYVGESTVGSMYSYGVALEFDRPGAAKDPDNLRKFEQMVERIKTFPLTKKTTSLLDIVKDMNQTLNAGAPRFYRIPESREMIAQLLLLYENAGGSEAEKWIDYDYQRLRLMVEVTNYNSAEAARELRAIRQLGKELFPDAQVLLIGSLPQYTVMMDYVTWGQVKSFFLALGVISILMTVVFGSLRIGLIAMIPNIAPALAVGGIMGFAGIPLDIMTVTIMPMLLGLAVDDTIHFINHSQLEYRRTGNYRETTRKVFVMVGTAMLFTSLVLILSFSAYLISPAKVFVNMGILVGAGTLAALLADFFVTPVLLYHFRVFGEEKGSA